MNDAAQSAGATTRIGLEGERFWPEYPPGHPMRTLAMTAFLEVTGLSSAHPDGQATAPGKAELVLRVSCLPELHRVNRQAGGSQLGVPMLAEVRKTSCGLLYVASLPGRWGGLPRPDQPQRIGGPTAAAELPADDGGTKGDSPVPVTIVRVLLETPDRPDRIPVKCRDHPEMTIDTSVLHRKAIEAQEPGRSARRRVVSVAAVRRAVG